MCNLIWQISHFLFQLEYMDLFFPLSDTASNYIPPMPLISFVTGPMSFRMLLFFLHFYLNILVIAACYAFLSWQILIIVRGQTSYEAWKMIRVYDLGLVGNILTTFGNPVYSWILLFAPLLLPMNHDGIKWTTKPKSDKGHWNYLCSNNNLIFFLLTIITLH